jgi:DNA polymerase III epsilon subunit-like protein
MIVVDVETTGTDPREHCIVSIGAVDFAQPERQFYRECQIFDGAKVEAEALAVNGFSIEQITDPGKMTLEQTVAEFIAWCRPIADRTLGGHNTAFDRDFLQASADRFNLAWRFGNRILDLHSLCWMHMARCGTSQPLTNGRSGISADTIFQYVGLPEEPKPHNGLTGAQMEAEAFNRLAYGRPLLEEFKIHPLPAYTATMSVPASDQQSLF